MHQANLDLTLEEISKIEGAASLNLSIKNNQLVKCEFIIAEYKRFYTQAVKNKSVMAVPAFLSRICGTCSNAHILAACKAVESALKITPSRQTQRLRQLLLNGLYIRDHALHLYLFVLPDLFNKDSLLDFDEKNPEEHQWLDDAFSVKDAGNQLSILAGGRSVHAPYPQVGGFNHFPESQKIPALINQLQSIKPAVSRLIKLFQVCPWKQQQKVTYLALSQNSSGYYQDLKRVILASSQAAAYTYKNQLYFTGALARLNLAEKPVPPFPSTNLYHNNLAQAVEILQAIDDSIQSLKQTEFQAEALVQPAQTSGQGMGMIEAPRGMLYHSLTIKDMVVTDAEILVPTGQNQLCLAEDIKNLVTAKLKSGPLNKKALEQEIEILVRAYDPCMSCASHFLKVKWF